MVSGFLSLHGRRSMKEDVTDERVGEGETQVKIRKKPVLKLVKKSKKHLSAKNRV